MDSKFRLIFIFSFVFVVFFGGSQMLMVEGGGLECSICLRIGDAGSKTCARMPCNSVDDRKAANNILRAAIDDILKSDEFKKVQDDTKNTTGEEILKEVDIEEGDSDDGDGDKTKTKAQEFECVKGIGEQTLKQQDGKTFKLRMVEGSCQTVNHKQDYPARTEPYKSLSSYDGMLPDTVIEMQSLWICNQTNQLTCKITQEELEKGVLEVMVAADGGTEVTKASGASPSPHLLPDAVSWLVLFCVSQLMIDRFLYL